MAKQHWSNSKSAQQFTEQVSKRVVGQIGEDKAPWQKGWDKATGADQPPYNPVSGKRFKGLNSIQLRSVAEERGYSDPRWMTYNTANKIGAKIRKGERGTRVEYVRFPPKDESKTQGAAGGKTDKDDKDGKEQERPKITHQTYVVFNAEQVDRMPALESATALSNPGRKKSASGPSGCYRHRERRSSRRTAIGRTTTPEPTRSCCRSRRTSRAPNTTIRKPCTSWVTGADTRAG